MRIQCQMYIWWGLLISTVSENCSELHSKKTLRGEQEEFILFFLIFNFLFGPRSISWSHWLLLFWTSCVLPQGFQIQSRYLACTLSCLRDVILKVILRGIWYVGSPFQCFKNASLRRFPLLSFSNRWTDNSDSFYFPFCYFISVTEMRRYLQESSISGIMNLHCELPHETLPSANRRTSHCSFILMIRLVH